MNKLVLKVFSFQFITISTSLFYYAFFTKDRAGSFVRISVTIFSLMIAGQWWTALTDICIPAIAYRVMKYRLKVQVLRTNRSIYRAREYTDFHAEKTGKGNGNGDADGNKKATSAAAVAAMKTSVDKR
jgi:hypothetical protein